MNSLSNLFKQNNLPFKDLLKKSMAELQLKTQAHRELWGLGSYDQWNLNQDDGLLVFSNKDGGTAYASAQIIGTFDSTNNTWRWAWANESIVDTLKKDSLTVKEYGEKHKIDKLITPEWTGTEDDAWNMTAFAMMLCNQQGAYKGPSGTTYIFITFGPVKIKKGK